MPSVEALARVFKALSSDTRIRILQLIGGRVLCVGALSAQLDVTQGAVSQHLRILREAGLVIAEKRGQYVHYGLNDAVISKLPGEMAGLFGSPGKQGAKRCATRKRRAARSRKS